MNAVIIGERSETTATLGKVLEQHRIRYCCDLPSGFQGLSQYESNTRETPQLVFLIRDSATGVDLELIRQLRVGYEGAIVVVADVPNHSAVIQTIRAGASDFVDIAADLADEVSSILSSLQVKCSGHSSPSQLATVLPCGDPADANVVSANLAVVIAQNRGGCILLDFHLRGGDLCHLLHLAPQHSVLDLLRVRDDVDQMMFDQALVDHDSGVRLLAGPEMFSDLRDIRPSIGHRLITMARSTGPFVILNAEDALHAEQTRGMASSDYVILTTRLNMVSLRRTKKCLGFLLANGVPTERIHVVAMGAGREAEISPRDVSGALSLQDIYCIPGDDLAEMVSINVGRPMVLEMPNSKAARAIVNLYKRITGQEHENTEHDGWRATIKAATIAATSILAHAR